jgi:hypothetical protein
MIAGLMISVGIFGLVMVLAVIIGSEVLGPPKGRRGVAPPRRFTEAEEQELLSPVEDMIRSIEQREDTREAGRRKIEHILEIEQRQSVITKRHPRPCPDACIKTMQSRYCIQCGW